MWTKIEGANNNLKGLWEKISDGANKNLKRLWKKYQREKITI